MEEMEEGGLSGVVVGVLGIAIMLAVIIVAVVVGGTVIFALVTA